MADRVASKVQELGYDEVVVDDWGNIVEKIQGEIGESTECNLNIGQRGRAEIIIKTFGRSAHSSNPRSGINAVYQMILVTEGIVNIKLPRDEFLGEAIIELTDIISRPYPGASMLPDLCMVTYDQRLLVGESKEEILEAIKNAIAQTSKGAPQLNATVEYCHGRATCYTGARISAEKYSPAWLTSGDSQLVKTALSALAGIG